MKELESFEKDQSAPHSIEAAFTDASTTTSSTSDQGEKLRVAYILGKYCPGGVVSYAKNYYFYMDKESIQIDFYVYDNSPFKDYSEILAHGGRVFEIPPLSRLFACLKACKLLFSNNKYDVVHGFLNTLNPFIMFAAKRAGVPVRIAENLSTGHSSEKKTVIKAALKPFAKCFSTSFAANSFLAAEWLYGASSANDCLIIPNVIETDQFAFSESLRETTRDRGNWSDKFVVGCIGRFETQKNHLFLLEIFNEILKLKPNSVLLLVGYGTLEESLVKKMHALGIEDAVIRYGMSTDNAPLYCAMDCFVLPSLYEGLPMVVIEAQASGLACILSSEITEESKLLDSTSFISLDSSASVWALEILSSKSEDRKDAYLKVEQAGHSAHKEANRLVEHYRRLLKAQDSQY